MYENKLSFQSQIFKLRFAVLFLGENEMGHYIVIDKMKNKVFSDGVSYENNYQEENLVYALLY